MNVEFKTIEQMVELGVYIHFKTMIRGIDDTIYEYIHNDCVSYFYKTTDYIGVIINDDFYVINLINDFFDEKFKKEFKFLDNVDISFNSNNQIKQPIIKKLNNIENFDYMTLPCLDIKELNETNEKLKRMTETLCPEYSFTINYIFQTSTNTEISIYGYNFPWTLLLCVFHNNKCISSLAIKEIDNLIWFDSKTNESYQRKNLNKILRAVIIIIAKDLYPDVEGVCSYAINYVSCIIMKKFNARFFNIEYEELEDFSDTEDLKRYLRINKAINCVVELTEENINNAKEILDNTYIPCENNRKEGKGHKQKYKTKRKHKTKQKHRKHKKKQTRK